MTWTRKIPLVAALVLIGAALLAVTWRQRGREDAGVVRVAGNIEITDADVGFKIAGRVVERRVSEGELVEVGDVVARLDDAELRSELAMREAERDAAAAVLAELEAGSRPQEIAEAEAAWQRARAVLEELQTGSRPQEIEVAQASVARAEAELADAQTNYERVRELHERSMAAEQEFNSAKARYDAAVARRAEAAEQLKLVQEGPRTEQIAQARAAVAEAEQRLALVRQGPRQEEIAQARARLAQAVAAVELARTRLGYATLVAPLNGVVLSHNIEAGEYVAAGTPVVTVGDLDDLWVRVYINETDLGRVKLGQPADVTTDTYPGKVYQGRVTFISSQAEFTPRSVQTQKERVKLVYRVKIDLPNPDRELKPGMPADAAIHVQGAT